MTAVIPEVRELTEDPDPTFPPDPPSSSFDTDPGAGEWRCEVCGDPITTPSGRKPRTMLCAEHRATKGVNQDKAKTTARSHNKIAEGMTAVHVMLGFMVGSAYLATKDEVWLRDKDIINNQAETIGEAWAKVTDTTPKLRKKVEDFLESFGTLTLLAAYAPVTVAIGTNHGQNAKAKQAQKEAAQAAQGS